MKKVDKVSQEKLESEEYNVYEEVRFYFDFWLHHSDLNWRRVSNYTTIVSIGMAIIGVIVAVTINSEDGELISIVSLISCFIFSVLCLISFSWLRMIERSRRYIENYINKIKYIQSILNEKFDKKPSENLKKDAIIKDLRTEIVINLKSSEKSPFIIVKTVFQLSGYFFLCSAVICFSFFINPSLFSAIKNLLPNFHYFNF